MVEYLSYDHAVNAIRLMYKKDGFLIEKDTPGELVYREFKTDVRLTRLAALYALVDEQVALFRIISGYFLFAIPFSKLPALTYYRLAVKQLRTLSSIRVLCSCGWDTNARLQLRLLYETSLLWTRFKVDSIALSEYELSATPEMANAYWHKYLAKGKTEKYLQTEFHSRGHTWLGGLDEHISQMKKLLSLVAHPSLLASSFDTMADWHDEKMAVAVGEPTEASHFTLSQSILVASIPFSVFPEPSYELGPNSFPDDQIPIRQIPHSSTSWSEYNQLIRNLMPSIFLLAIRFSNELRKSSIG